MTNINITIDAKTMEGLPLKDPKLIVEIRRTYPADNLLIGNFPFRDFDGNVTFPVPYDEGTMTRWQLTADFSLFDGGAPFSFFPSTQTAPQWDLVAARLPNRWKPVFAPLADLASPAFDALKAVLRLSNKVDLKTVPNTFFDLNAQYDTLSTPAGVLGKAALLNLYAVLSELTDPLQTCAQGRPIPWFNHILKIVRIDQERFVAEVTPAMFESVDHIQRHLNSTYAHQGYSIEGPLDYPLHYPNIPAAYGGDGAKRPPSLVDMISLKRAYQKGDVQLTVSFFRFPDGSVVHLLDCDMDESVNIIGHSFDLLKHLITHTGTTPIYMHEFIVEDSAKQSAGHVSTIDLGYALQVA